MHEMFLSYLSYFMNLLNKKKKNLNFNTHHRFKCHLLVIYRSDFFFFIVLSVFYYDLGASRPKLRKKTTYLSQHFFLFLKKISLIPMPQKGIPRSSRKWKKRSNQLNKVPEEKNMPNTALI